MRVKHWYSFHTFNHYHHFPLYSQLDYQNVDFSHVNSDMQSVPSTPSSPTTPHSPVLINDYINTNGNGLAGGGGRVSQLAYYNHNYVSGVNSFTTSFTFRKQRSQRRVCTSDLICFAFQCARGMEYLTSRKVSDLGLCNFITNQLFFSFSLYTGI